MREKKEIAPGRNNCPVSLRAISYFAETPETFFCAAHRRLTASAIRFRPSGERFLFLFFAGLIGVGATADKTFLGLPGPRFAVETLALASNARALCNWAISRSMLARISEIPMVPPLDTGDYFHFDDRCSYAVYLNGNPEHLSVAFQESAAPHKVRNSFYNRETQ
jgi:hypothetical protein